HAIWIGDAVALTECCRSHAVRLQPGRAPCGGRGVEPLDLDAEAALQRDIPAKRVDAFVGGDEEEIPVLMKVDGMADFIGEPFEQPDRFDGQPDVGRVRELVPYAAGVASG